MNKKSQLLKTLFFIGLFLCGMGVHAEVDLSSDFGKKIVQAGYDPTTVVDWSNNAKIKIEKQPRLAYVNISDVVDENGNSRQNSMPTDKIIYWKGNIEAYDGNGNYFKKKMLFKAQGNMTVSRKWPKQNFAVDFCEDEWLGETTTDITIGDWVKQDSYHFKAHYNDFYRGCNSMGYNLFDFIVKDRQLPWQKEGLNEDVDPDNDASEGALCHPQGFPCIVYLNGKFYGIFSWTLKKHRKNYGLNKDNANHIQLDGYLRPNDFWQGKPDWAKLSVKNPKDLSCNVSCYKYKECEMDESVEYVTSIDNPEKIESSKLNSESTKYLVYVTKKGNTKYYKLAKTYLNYNDDYTSMMNLIDSTSTYFDPEDEQHVRTNIVKRSIISISYYCKTYGNSYNDWGKMKRTEYDLINKNESTKMSSADSISMRNKLAERFDIESLIDYYIFCLISGHYDGYHHNWQWFTYDGKKWYVSPYDLDGLFGNTSYGRLVMPAEWTSAFDDYRMDDVSNCGPFYWLRKYFADQIHARYADLRKSKAISQETMESVVKDWAARVGQENYDLEYSKWTKTTCNSETILNPNWSTTDDWTDYTKISGKEPNAVRENSKVIYNTYDPNKTYNAGDKCITESPTGFGGSNVPDYRIWIATGTTKGVYPFKQMGYTDSMERHEQWIKRRLELEDDFLLFDEGMVDFNLLINYLLELETVNEIQKEKLDFNRDKEINIADATYYINKNNPNPDTNPDSGKDPDPGTDPDQPNVDSSTFEEAINGHDYIDLGFKDDEGNSILWATYNIGASTVEDYGRLYAWGEIHSKDIYNWNNYQYGSTVSDLTKYNSKDKLRKLQLSDDVAYQKLGGNWHMPTIKEFEQLINNCTWKWKQNGNINGYELTSKINGKNIFLPATGVSDLNNGYIGPKGIYGVYWGSEVMDSSEANRVFGYMYAFQSSGFFTNHSGDRYQGRAVRAVCTVKEITTEIEIEPTDPETPSLSEDELILKAAANGHQYVDIGLKDANGKTIYWATCNLGASKPTDTGSYYQWGETAPDTPYNWNNYKYCKASDTSMTKYCNKSEYGSVDNLVTLEPEDDAAHINWQGNWRMPTIEEMLLLTQQCTWKLYLNNNSEYSNGGYLVTGPNGKSIFLPNTGCYHDYYTHHLDMGKYWSSSLYTTKPNSGCYIKCTVDEYPEAEFDYQINGKKYVPDYSKHYYIGDSERNVGHAIRAVFTID